MPDLLSILGATPPSGGKSEITRLSGVTTPLKDGLFSSVIQSLAIGELQTANVLPKAAAVDEDASDEIGTTTQEAVDVDTEGSDEPIDEDTQHAVEDPDNASVDETAIYWDIAGKEQGAAPSESNDALLATTEFRGHPSEAIPDEREYAPEAVPTTDARGSGTPEVAQNSGPLISSETTKSPQLTGNVSEGMARTDAPEFIPDTRAVLPEFGKNGRLSANDGSQVPATDTSGAGPVREPASSRNVGWHPVEAAVRGALLMKAGSADGRSFSDPRIALAGGQTPAITPVRNTVPETDSMAVQVANPANRSVSAVPVQPLPPQTSVATDPSIDAGIQDVRIAAPTAASDLPETFEARFGPAGRGDIEATPKVRSTFIPQHAVEKRSEIHPVSMEKPKIVSGLQAGSRTIDEAITTPPASPAESGRLEQVLRSDVSRPEMHALSGTPAQPVRSSAPRDDKTSKPGVDPQLGLSAKAEAPAASQEIPRPVTESSPKPPRTAGTSSGQPNPLMSAAAGFEAMTESSGSDYRSEQVALHSVDAVKRTHEGGPMQAMVAARPEVAREIGRQMAPSIIAAADGSVDIALSPKELGHIRMSLSVTETGVTLMVSGERLETLDLMRRHSGELSAAFREMGYHNIAFSFGTGSGGDNAQKPQDPTNAVDSPDLGNQDPAPAGNEGNPGGRTRTVSAGGGLDIRI